MTRILRIDSSSRPSTLLSGDNEGSFSRNLADIILEQLRSALSVDEVVIRDLAANPLPHIANETIQGYYTPAEAMTDALRGATAMSNELIVEIEAADILLLSVPIYNFSVPSALKAWVDQIVRIGRTFAYEDGEFRGLVDGKRAYVAYAYGAAGYGEGGPLETFDNMKPYVTMILNFIGITDVTSFAIEGTTADAVAIGKAHQSAIDAIAGHFRKSEFA